VTVTVVHTNGVNLLFITLDTVRGTNVISEKPSLRLLLTIEQGTVSNGHVDGGLESTLST